MVISEHQLINSNKWHHRERKHEARLCCMQKGYKLTQYSDLLKYFDCSSRYFSDVSLYFFSVQHMQLKKYIHFKSIAYQSNKTTRTFSNKQDQLLQHYKWHTLLTCSRSTAIFPGEPGLASSPIDLPSPFIPKLCSSCNKPKLFIFSLTQSQHILFGQLFCLVPSTSSLLCVITKLTSSSSNNPLINFCVSFSFFQFTTTHRGGFRPSSRVFRKTVKIFREFFMQFLFFEKKKLKNPKSRVIYLIYLYSIYLSI